MNQMATVGTANQIFVFRLGPYMSRTAQDMLMALWALLLALTAAAIGIILTIDAEKHSSAKAIYPQSQRASSLFP